MNKSNPQPAHRTAIEPYTFYQFSVPRKHKEDSRTVLLVNCMFMDQPEADHIVLLDWKKYEIGEPRKFTTVPAQVFYTLMQKGQVEKVIPVV